MDDHIALLATMHPASRPKQATLLAHLRRGAREYYRLPSACCTTWSYLEPMTQAKDEELAIAGLEIYTAKSALQDQLNDKTFYQPFEEMVVRDEMYAKQGSMTAWYLAAGYLTLRKERVEGGAGVCVRIKRLICKEGERDAVVKGFGDLAEWSRAHWADLGLLTFAVFTRKKAEREVLTLTRFRDEECMRVLEASSELREFRKVVGPLLVVKETIDGAWREVDDSFVSPMPRGTTAKL